MADESFLNSVTLQFLLNPSLQNKIHKREQEVEPSLMNDILFYRRRIAQQTKQMCKGEYVNDVMRASFLNYAATLVYNFKQLDEKDIFQKEYDDLQSNNKVIVEQLETEEITDISQNLGNDYILTAAKNDYRLDRFISRKNIREVERVLPRERVANIKDPQLKRKGLKKKNL